MSPTGPRLRLARPTDAEAMLAIYAPLVRDTIVSFELRPPSRDEMAARIETLVARLPWLVAEIDEHVVGYAYAAPYRSREAYQWSVEASVYVASSRQRQGLAGRLYRALFSILRAQGIRNVYGGIALPNEGSVLFHESLGFEPIGVYRSAGYKLGAWHDVGWWGLFLGAEEDDDATPAPPRRLGLMRSAIEGLIQPDA